MTFYAGSVEALCDDLSVPIEDVVAEAERLCRREACASANYRREPHLLYQGHPWVLWVQAGHGQYLGWEPDEPFQTGDERLKRLAVERAGYAA